MSRRSLHVAIAAVLVVVVVLFAASSGPGSLWVNPPAGGQSTTQPNGDTPIITDRPIDQAEPTERWPGWVGGVLRFVAVGLLVALLIGAAALAATGRPPHPRWGRRLTRRSGSFSALPEAEPALAIDVVSARRALTRGTPRNGIVACWMQLEDDAAAAGLARFAAETPAEYVERVVSASSVDPSPIVELAALYREARFSRHELSDAHRIHAVAALERVAAGLTREAGMPV